MTDSKQSSQVEVVFSNTYNIDDYRVEKISLQLFEELEKKRNGKMWVSLDESPKESGHYETYHGPV